MNGAHFSKKPRRCIWKKNQANERKKQLHMLHILKQKFKLDEEAK